VNFVKKVVKWLGIDEAKTWVVGLAPDGSEIKRNTEDVQGRATPLGWVGGVGK